MGELEKLKKELTRYNLTTAHTILSKWLERAKSSFPLLTWEDRSQSSQFPSIGFPVAYSGFQRAYKVFLQIDTWHNYIYYGIYLAEADNMPFAEARDFIRQILSFSFTKGRSWWQRSVSWMQWPTRRQTRKWVSGSTTTAYAKD